MCQQNEPGRSHLKLPDANTLRRGCVVRPKDKVTIPSGAAEKKCMPRLTDDNHAHVHDVGLRQPGEQEAAGKLEEVIGIVPLEKGSGREAGGAGPSVGVGDGARGVGGAVLAVGAAAENGHLAYVVGAELGEGGE